MKKTLLCFKAFLFFFFSVVTLYSQNKTENRFVEKVYLHTDRTTYFLGEDLWYKAYNVNANNNTLTDNSNILYVELISPDSKIISRHKTNLEMGLGHGDFKLIDSIGVKPGVYQLRAYTNWNRNYGDDFVFKKNIEIIDVFQSHFNTEITGTKLDSKSVVEESNQNIFSIDFFPEGGSLLQNVASVIGFKAVDVNGNPIEVEGDIYDSNHQKVTSFSSVHDGMGTLQIIPLQGNAYYAIARIETGEELLVELPKVLTEGYLISFKRFKGRNIVSVNTNQETLSANTNRQIKIIFSSKSIPYLEVEQTIGKTITSFEIPSDKLPEGISQITLYDNTSKPQSERLIYIEKAQDLSVELTTDKSSYQPNEEVEVSISSTTISGEPQSGSFSLSVTDMNGLEDDKNNSSTICSYFLMESDIRGEVFHPNYYFNPENSKRLEHLDHVLLTQGWRDFLWKTQPMQNDTITFKAEKGFTISGRVKQLLGNKPSVNNNVTLAVMNNKNFNAFSSKTDSLGQFQFKDLMFSGKSNIQLNSRNEKGKYSGEILIDSLEEVPIQVSYKSEWNRPDLDNTVIENVYKKYVEFGVQPENVLKEVTIIASANKKEDIVANYGNYGFADKSYVADEDVHLFSTIGELLMVKFPNISGSEIYIVDGRQINPDEKSYFVDNIQPDDIVKIDIITEAQATLFFGIDGKNGVVAIYTKPNTGNKAKKEGISTVKKEIEGFYKARKFYVPTIKSEKSNNRPTDIRNTIYWNPYVHPDKTGKASVNYTNSSIETKVKVSLEGITTAGIPVVRNTYYTVKRY
ncbi:alpha-2-macroglobulin family protein [Aestuariibaculum marinum]|uniref:TonB-dependent receptor plug domain-containing protein n=1 Tax=Aestuariibaculum marinum TaxID=2683592 RepID=A0A8J6Q7F0_9FLAO|nr:hypothetical protein [Aestuariibaculum marinum]MBD0824883.1 hypothetical protein [Aestuariibaculum marinum]